jgi:hypothetical protein
MIALDRNVPAPRPAGLTPWVVVTVMVVALAGFVSSGSRLTVHMRVAREDIARAGVEKLAIEAYPQWLARTGGGCPTIGELADVRRRDADEGGRRARRRAGHALMAQR